MSRKIFDILEGLRQIEK